MSVGVPCATLRSAPVIKPIGGRCLRLLQNHHFGKETAVRFTALLINASYNCNSSGILSPDCYQALVRRNDFQSSIPSADMISVLTPALLLLPLGLWLLVRVFEHGRRARNLPPGPPTTPFLGNHFDVYKLPTYLQYSKLAKEYGEIFSLKSGPSGTIVVLNSPEAIQDVMERQGALTSGRPMKVVSERITGGLMIGITQPSELLSDTNSVINKSLICFDDL